MTGESCSSFPLTVAFCFVFSFPCPFPPSSLGFLFFLSSKDAPSLTLPHHGLNLSIFCHGEKHLNLSLHLFITCHLRFLLLLPFLSPPLHLCVPSSSTPPFYALCVLVSVALRSNKHQLSCIVNLQSFIFAECKCSRCKLGKRRVFPSRALSHVLRMFCPDGGETKHPSINN